MRATLIFDLDGTLSDPFEGIARCYEHALATHGYPVAPRSELAKLIGPPLDDGMRKLGVPDAEIPAVVATYRVRYSSHGYAENRVYDGIAEALATLGGRLGVCTSKRDDFAERILERGVEGEAPHAIGLASCGVRWVVGSRDVLESAKPRYLLVTPGEPNPHS